MLLLDEEQELVERIRDRPLREFEFHGFTGKRRVISFGWHYDFAERALQLRRKSASAWERYSLTMEPRSFYLLTGAARTEWQYSSGERAALLDHLSKPATKILK